MSNLQAICNVISHFPELELMIRGYSGRLAQFVYQRSGCSQAVRPLRSDLKKGPLLRQADRPSRPHAFAYGIKKMAPRPISASQRSIAQPYPEIRIQVDPLRAFKPTDQKVTILFGVFQGSHGGIVFVMPLQQFRATDTLDEVCNFSQCKDLSSAQMASIDLVNALLQCLTQRRFLSPNFRKFNSRHESLHAIEQNLIVVVCLNFSAG